MKKKMKFMLMINNVDLELAEKIQKVIVEYNIEKGVKARKEYLKENKHEKGN